MGRGGRKLSDGGGTGTRLSRQSTGAESLRLVAVRCLTNQMLCGVHRVEYCGVPGTKITLSLAGGPAESPCLSSPPHHPLTSPYRPLQQPPETHPPPPLHIPGTSVLYTTAIMKIYYIGVRIRFPPPRLGRHENPWPDPDRTNKQEADSKV